MPVPARRPELPLLPREERPRVARSRPRARRGIHARFAVLAGGLVACLLVGVVSLQAILAQTSFHTAQLQSQMSELGNRYQSLVGESARLSSPARIEAWAATHGMRVPDAEHTVILQVPPRAGAPESGVVGPGREADLVKSILGAGGE